MRPATVVLGLVITLGSSCRSSSTTARTLAHGSCQDLHNAIAIGPDNFPASRRLFDQAATDAALAATQDHHWNQLATDAKTTSADVDNLARNQPNALATFAGPARSAQGACSAIGVDLGLTP